MVHLNSNVKKLIENKFFFYFIKVYLSVPMYFILSNAIRNYY
jgi:hypothetical protein